MAALHGFQVPAPKPQPKAREASLTEAAKRLLEERRRGLGEFFEGERRARLKHEEEEAERQHKRLEANRLKEYPSHN